MNDLTFIPDGYEMDGEVPAVKGLHGGFKFRYRPTTADEQDELRAKNAGQDVAKQNAATRAAIAAKLVSWEIKTPDGQEVPVSVDNLKRLHPAVYDRLYWIVCEGEPDGLPPTHSSKHGREVGSSEDAAVKN